MKPLPKFTRGIKINQVIQFLTYSDILMLSGWGLINPILAVFVTEQVIGGSVALAGLAATVYFATKSIVQVPVARWIDLHKGEKDDYFVMVAGSLLITSSAFLFSWVTYPWQVFVAQFINALGGALSYPSWLAIFTRHIDKNEAGLEWSLYYTATDLGAALTAGTGGFLAATIGYKYLFLIVGTMSLIGTIFLAGVTRRIKKRG